MSKLLAGLSSCNICLAFMGFSKVEAAARSFRDETGLLRSQTIGLERYYKCYLLNFALEHLRRCSKSSIRITNAFEGLEQPSARCFRKHSSIRKEFWCIFINRAAVNAQFQQLSGLSAEAAQHQITQFTQHAKLAGVAPKSIS